jgi:cytoskeleton protein RodZ
MTETTPTAAEPARTADPSRQSPGEYLRRLREEKGHTHAAVGSALHLTAHYIKALETDEYGKLPGLTFVKGYLRSYARFLGADVDNVIARFDEHIAGLLDAGMATARVERSKRRQDQALRWAIGAGFVVVASLVAGWWFMSGNKDAPVAAQGTSPAVAQESTARIPPPVTTTAAPARSAAPQSITTPAVVPQVAAQQTPVQAPGAQNIVGMTGTITAPANTLSAATAPPVVATPGLTGGNTAIITNPATNPATAVTTPVPGGARNVSLIASGNDELRVVFNGNSWIEVDDGRKVRLYNDMLRTGDTLTIRGMAPFHVLFGDASRVQISLNAVAVDISADVRPDKTARLVLGAPVPETDAAPVQEATPMTTQEPASAQAPAVTPAPAAPQGVQQ